jgi:PIN domain nuclease of toxin-antitoxin system
MGYLLDTHALIWFLNGNKELSFHARKTIETNISIHVSMASLWEMAIKISTGKLVFDEPFDTIPDKIDYNGFQILPISFEDTLMLSKLPFHHRDPFDRILIAQSITNSFTLISKDKEFKNYPLNLLW